jgi:serine protease Do
MKPTPRIHRILFFVLSTLVLISCSVFGGSSDGEEPPSKEPEIAEEAEEQPVSPSGSERAVTSLTDVKTAVIQIGSVGTFIDPEFGEYSGAGSGSGFIIDPSGLALTNNHVVTGSALIEVWVGGDTSRTYNAQIVAVSECSDLALIDIEGDGFPFLEWYPDPITVGLEVYAAGFPLGDPEFTLTKGIVSKEQANGESSWSSVSQVIEHDATINPGNSGGPLVTDNGQVVGVNYASFAEAGQFFAIGRDTTRDILKQFDQDDSVDSVGINGVAVVNNDGTLSGIWVSSVRSGSPADEAGVVPGDLITSMEGFPLATDGSMADYCKIIRTQGDENTLALEVIRFETSEVLEGQFNGRELTVVSTFDDSVLDDGGDEQVDDGAGDSGIPMSDYILDVFDDGFMSVTDEYEALYLEVPTSWDQIDGALWTEYWGDLYFEAASVVAAPDLDAFYSSYAASGVNFAASEDWGNIGGYIGLLDGTKHWFQDSCTIVEREDYEDPVYEGAYDIWDCGRNAQVVVIGVRPIADPTAFLALVQVQVTEDADYDALERIIDSFDLIDGYLP